MLAPLDDEPTADKSATHFWNSVSKNSNLCYHKIITHDEDVFFKFFWCEKIGVRLAGTVAESRAFLKECKEGRWRDRQAPSKWSGRECC